MKRLLAAVLGLGAALAPHPAHAIGQARYVLYRSAPGAFPLAGGKSPAPIYTDSADWPGVIRAAADLRADIGRVTGMEPALVHDSSGLGSRAVIVGTIGRSSTIDRLIREKKIDASGVAGNWESFVIQVVARPLPGVDSALVIAGSDKRGAIYGIYDLSEQIGVSPWYFWADVPVVHRDALYINPGRFIEGPPAVKYRGIFLNDESPALSGWVQEKFGMAPVTNRAGQPGDVVNMGHEFYAKVFELILRLKGNYLWPAMWNNAFNEDDPQNPKLADEYGIVMGNSHHEPMLRAQKEWTAPRPGPLGLFQKCRRPARLLDRRHSPQQRLRKHRLHRHARRWRYAHGRHLHRSQHQTPGADRRRPARHHRPRDESRCHESAAALVRSTKRCRIITIAACESPTT